ncbi:WYL domain-containing protein [Myxococcaceae bacterium JPH2]|nr:WYL domain-containing protein [Myxococcaceae bacterium JPH2]
MRADRLVHLLMRLQARPRSTVGALARELQVSGRTVLRDLEALSTAGVPVTTTRGAGGGVSLMEGWRTQLTGLTRPELQALASVGAPGALEDLGLSGPLRTGLVKLAAALPSLQQPALEHARQRLLVDASGWFTTRERVPHLGVLRDAAWQDQRVTLTYQDFEGARTRRPVDPYGLVIKADRWYLVAGTEKGPRVFRGSRIEGARRRPQGFTRPADFDLNGFWKDWCARFATERPRYEVTLRCTEAGVAALRALRPPSEAARLDAALRGKRQVVLDFEREAIAVSQLCGVGAAVEVLAPEALRQRLGAVGAALQSLYGASGRRRSA